MQRFQRLHELNDRAKIKALHISLNFDPSEKLSNEKMTAIADLYMEGIGLDKQPYIVYRHNDVGHEHMHIVTSLIREDGKRIPTHNMGMNLSEPTRKAIEKEFDLIPAQGKKQLALQQSASSGTSKDRQDSYDDPVQKVIYGKANGTRDSVHRVLEMVNRDYTFTSLCLAAGLPIPPRTHYRTAKGKPPNHAFHYISLPGDCWDPLANPPICAYLTSFIISGLMKTRKS